MSLFLRKHIFAKKEYARKQTERKANMAIFLFVKLANAEWLVVLFNSAVNS